MKDVWVIPVIFGIAVMMMLSVLPAMAFHSNPFDVIGEVVFVNKANKHGTIEHIVLDGSGGFTTDGTKYQYLIPQDLRFPDFTHPSVGDIVQFSIVPENSRHATDVRFSSDCPPLCGGF